MYLHLYKYTGYTYKYIKDSCHLGYDTMDVAWYIITYSSEEHTASIFRAEATLKSG
jgi:hypothetical protein